MKKLFLSIEAYARLSLHDLFMSRRDLAALLVTIKDCRVRAGRYSTAQLDQVAESVDLACAFYPKQALCLQRSAVLVKMLRKRGVPAKIIIGAQKLPFRAHAWVEVEGKIVNDRLAAREEFLVMEVC
jgi:hypothetical protein